MVKILPLFVVRILISTGLINLMTGYFKYARRKLSDVLDELTDNVELKSVLAFSFGDYGLFPLVMFSISQNEDTFALSCSQVPLVFSQHRWH